jgi:hypothetical protein
MMYIIYTTNNMDMVPAIGFAAITLLFSYNSVIARGGMRQT